MAIIESVVESFKIYKENTNEAAMDSLKLFLVNLLLMVPFIGPIWYPKYFVAILREIAEKYKLTVGGMNEEEAKKGIFRIVTIPTLILHVTLVIALISLILTGGISLLIGKATHGFEGLLALLGFAIVGVIISAIVSFVMYLLYSYPTFAIIVGKERELNSNIGGSVKLLIVGAIVGIIFSILDRILGVVPIVGWILTLAISIFVSPIVTQLALLHYVSKS